MGMMQDGDVRCGLCGDVHGPGESCPGQPKSAALAVHVGAHPGRRAAVMDHRQ
jgi:hypothetical protein